MIFCPAGDRFIAKFASQNVPVQVGGSIPPPFPHRTKQNFSQVCLAPTMHCNWDLKDGRQVRVFTDNVLVVTLRCDFSVQ